MTILTWPLNSSTAVPKFEIGLRNKAALVGADDCSKWETGDDFQRCCIEVDVELQEMESSSLRKRLREWMHA
jgi:hypothetical protein